jgi:orotidine-5'-phosphate decarboxylase
LPPERFELRRAIVRRATLRTSFPMPFFNAIAVRERLVFALDVSTLHEARSWIDRLGDSVMHYKIGLELLGSGDYFSLLAELKHRGKRVFADLKLHDIPATVAAAVANLAPHGADLLTVHAYRDAIAAAAPRAGATRLLAITVLTSMDDAALLASGVGLGMAAAVERRARDAVDAGAAGVVCSGLEAAALRRALGDRALIVCPGIRSEPGGDDQQRTVSVEQAFAAGADYIVVGRPIRQAADPRAAAESIQQRIANLNA